MTVYTFILTYPKTNGRIASIAGAVWESETAATDALYQLYDLAYRLEWTGQHYKMISRGMSKKHTFDAHIIDFELIK